MVVWPNAPPRRCILHELSWLSHDAMFALSVVNNVFLSNACAGKAPVALSFATEGILVVVVRWNGRL